MLALVATPPAFFAARQVLTYTALGNAPIEVVEQVALGHRLFFVVYGMLAAALLAALTWEALFPDGRDQEIVGVLPVRPHTFAAARLWRGRQRRRRLHRGRQPPRRPHLHGVLRRPSRVRQHPRAAARARRSATMLGALAGVFHAA